MLFERSVDDYFSMDYPKLARKIANNKPIKYPEYLRNKTLVSKYVAEELRDLEIKRYKAKSNRFVRYLLIDTNDANLFRLTTKSTIYDWGYNLDEELFNILKENNLILE